MVSEIISRVERRRDWPDEVKARIVGEALAPGVTAVSVADRNGVCRSLLYTWLRLARQGRLPGISINAPPATAFVPVQISAPRPMAAPTMPVMALPASGPPPRRRGTVIEITLANGRTVKVDEGVDPAALGRLVAVLDRGGT